MEESSFNNSAPKGLNQRTVSAASKVQTADHGRFTEHKKLSNTLHINTLLYILEISTQLYIHRMPGCVSQVYSRLAVFRDVIKT